MIDKLKKLKLFQGLEDKELEIISGFSRFKLYNKDSIIYYEMDIKKELYYLSEGRVKVYKVDRFDNEIFMYYIYSDSLITKISNLSDRSICTFANTECEIDSEVLIIDYEKFSNFALDKPNILLTLINIFSKKSLMLECLINTELVYDGVSKVAFTLIDRPWIFIRQKRKDIAYQLNIQPETLSRILKKLSRKKLISTDNNEIVILDKDGLKLIYE